MGWGGDSLLRVQEGGNPVVSGSIPGGCSGCVGVPQCSRPPTTHTGSKVGVLGDGLREGLAGKCCGEARERSKEKCRFQLETGER